MLPHTSEDLKNIENAKQQRRIKKLEELIQDEKSWQKRLERKRKYSPVEKVFARDSSVQTIEALNMAIDLMRRPER
jgi:hypothetical protein